jgi:hypothetical protein
MMVTESNGEPRHVCAEAGRRTISQSQITAVDAKFACQLPVVVTDAHDDVMVEIGPAACALDASTIPLPGNHSW